jgi:hypothetical protein
MVLRSTLRANEKTDVKAQTSPSRARTPSAEQREASTPPTQPKGTQRQQDKKAILATTFVPPGSPPSTRRNCRSSASKALASDAGELKKVITSARKSLFNGSHETSVTCASSSLQEEETESNQVGCLPPSFIIWHLSFQVMVSYPVHPGENRFFATRPVHA